MREIGVRDLKRSLSETLRAVERGEQARVTVRPVGPRARVATDAELELRHWSGETGNASEGQNGFSWRRRLSSVGG